ncbi:RND transporter [Aliiroseovarius sp. F47248L]|uniref:RND transporter n=1 Tax=Aliiroseovarius sp. F47248L TaxID=2926420 RepID=UPI001FF13539|nr:RND transporter [Aliiroseovarius sp. F47248L]MCK0139096.1 RND transporter [Aliiroseovarius sp. F47248L]
MSIFDNIPFLTVVIFCLTIGLAPFAPPHIWEKLVMLLSGTLVRPLDILDLVMHGGPWVILLIKIVRHLRSGPTSREG